MAAAADRRGAIAVLALTCVLILVQAWCAFHSTAHVLEEELAEAVRNPLWVEHRLVYDGMSSNVAWYAVLALAYRLFGFSLFAAKLVRLALAAAALACLADLLIGWVGWRRALVPLSVIGLSPALLYFNTMMATYGIDLSWAPIVAWLLWRWRGAAASAATGMAVMTACLMWPVCVFYVPVAALALWTSRRRIVDVAAAAAGAALPFLVALAWLHNAALWIHDPALDSGVFRGGGGGFVHSAHALFANAWWMAKDIGVSGTSYYFWLPSPDLSGLTGLLGAAAVVAMLPQVWRSGRTARVLVVTCIAFSIVTTMIAAAAGGPPGFRRATGSLVAFYVLYVLCWQAAAAAWQQRPRAWRAAGQLAALSLLLVHHLSVLAVNGRSLAGGRPGIERWFTVAATPQDSLRHWSAAVARDVPLDCRSVGITTAAGCRYSSIYSAVAWSLGEARPIRAHDLANDVDVVVTPEAWPPSLAR